MPPKSAGNQKLAAKTPAPLNMSVVASAASASSMEAARDDVESPSPRNATIEGACLEIGKLASWQSYKGEPHVGFLKSSNGSSYMAYSGAQDADLDNQIDNIMERLKVPYKVIGKLSLDSSILQEYANITNQVRIEQGQEENDEEHKGANYGCAEKKLYSFLSRGKFEYETGTLRVFHVKGGKVTAAQPCASCVLCIAKFNEDAEKRKKDAEERFKMLEGGFSMVGEKKKRR